MSCALQEGLFRRTQDASTQAATCSLWCLSLLRRHKMYAVHISPFATLHICRMAAKLNTSKSQYLKNVAKTSGAAWHHTAKTSSTTQHGKNEYVPLVFVPGEMYIPTHGNTPTVSKNCDIPGNSLDEPTGSSCNGRTTTRLSPIPL